MPRSTCAECLHTSRPVSIPDTLKRVCSPRQEVPTRNTSRTEPASSCHPCTVNQTLQGNNAKTVPSATVRFASKGNNRISWSTWPFTILGQFSQRDARFDGDPSGRTIHLVRRYSSGSSSLGQDGFPRDTDDDKPSIYIKECQMISVSHFLNFIHPIKSKENVSRTKTHQTLTKHLHVLKPQLIYIYIIFIIINFFLQRWIVNNHSSLSLLAYPNTLT